MKIYQGKRIEEVGPQPVTVNGQPLKHKMYHSPDGFQWGYGGSGPADLARSILTDCLDEEDADKFYQKFKWDVVSRWGDSWQITEDEIREWRKRES